MKFDLDVVAIREMMGRGECLTNSPMIEHTVTFRLKHPPGSPEESAFLAAAAELTAIPGVGNFRIRRQTSAKNDHAFGISMEFETPAAFRAYCDHPEHVAFVETRWLPEVENFREADFAPMKGE